MHLAVVGGSAWFSGALDALIEREAGLPSAHICDDPARFPDLPGRGDAEIAILTSENGRESLRRKLEEWRRRYPELRVVIRMRSLRPDLVRDAIQMGAWGCFSEQDAPDVVLNVLKAVAAGRVSFPYVDFSSLNNDPFEQLTKREREVLAALSKGWTNVQISDRLGVSENTVKYHLKLIFEKLGVKTRAAAVAQYLNYAMA
ncbi:MAG: response regulator transcription factor [Pseudomonadota bacterium]